VVLELQIPATELSVMIRNRIRSMVFCITDPVAAGAETFYVDRVVANDTMSVEEHVEERKLRARQEVTVFLATLQAIQAAGVNPPETTPLNITLVIEVSVSVGGGGVTLDATLVDVEPNIPEVQQLLGSMGYSASQQLDLSALGSVLQTPVTITNAGIRTNGANQDGTVVSLRFELNGSPDSAAEFDAYFSGTLPDRRGGADWAMLVDAQLIVVRAVAMINAWLAANANAISVTSDPTGAWDAASGSVKVWFSGEAIDACLCIVDMIDVDFDAEVTIALSGEPGNLVMTITFIVDQSEFEGACCVFTATTAWPVVGILLLHDEEGAGEQVGHYILGLLGGAVGVSVQVLAGWVPLDDVEFGGPGGSECVELPGGEASVCKMPVTFSAAGMTLSLTSVAADPVGPLFRGSATPVPALGVPTLHLTAVGFEWRIGPGSCNKGFPTINYASIIVGAVGVGPVEICKVEVLDDPLGEYPIEIVDIGPQYNGVAEIRVQPKRSPAFLANPYPCKLMLFTNLGVRFLVLQPAAEITEQEKLSLAIQVAGMKAACKQWDDGFWGKGKLHLEWVGDPPPEQPVEHLWHVVVEGLTAEEEVEAVGSDDSVIVWARAASSGAAHLTTLIAPQRGRPDIGLARRGPDLERTEARRVKVYKVRLAKRAQVRSASSLAAGRLDGRPAVVVTSGSGARVYDVGGARPALFRQLPGVGLRGAVLWRGEALTFGDNGLGARSAGTAVLDLVRHGGHFYAAVKGGIDVLRASDLRRVGHQALEGVTRLGMAGRILAAATAREVHTFDLTRGDSPVLTGSIAISGATALAGPHVNGVRDALYVDTDGKGVLVDARRDAPVRELTRYAATPWFAGGVHAGRFLAVRKADAIVFYECLATHEV
jgi:hypothetical protein